MESRQDEAKESGSGDSDRPNNQGSTNRFTEGMMTDVEKIILRRLDNIEKKIDNLDSFKFKVIGGMIILSFLTSMGTVFLVR